MAAELLFNKIRFSDLATAVEKDAYNKIQGLKKSNFDKHTIDEVSAQIFEELKPEKVVLQEDKVYQREPKDVQIRLPSRMSSYGYREVPGTNFTIIVPYVGDEVLLTTQPNRFNSNPPAGEIRGKELYFEYELPASADKSEVYTAYERNLQNIKRWLEFSESDVEAFNGRFRNEIVAAVTQRKKKIDDDTSAASSSGIPIR